VWECKETGLINVRFHFHDDRNVSKKLNTLYCQSHWTTLHSVIVWNRCQKLANVDLISFCLSFRFPNENKNSFFLLFFSLKTIVEISAVSETFVSKSFLSSTLWYKFFFYLVWEWYNNYLQDAVFIRKSFKFLFVILLKDNSFFERSNISETHF